MLDSMTQCVVCEDWYHSRHLFSNRIVDVDPENNEAYFLDSKLEEKLFDNETTEVICVGCLNRYKFLADKSCLCTGSNEDERVDSVVI